MIDNYNLIIPLLEFEEGYFYYLQILQRKKENPQLGSNSRVIKNYYIPTKEYFDLRYDEIKKLCDVFNARASLRLNKRSYEGVSFKAMVNLANVMNNRAYDFANKSYDRAVGQSHNDKNKKWILDIDGPMDFGRLITFIKGIEPTGNKVYEIIPSKSGHHIITSPFNTKTFNEEFPEIEIHKDNPTNLYIPH